MKSRRVMMQLECETNAPMTVLRNKDSWRMVASDETLTNYSFELIQLHANSITRRKMSKKKKR